MRAWNRFWFAEVDARPFGLARIGVALAGLQMWAGTIPLVREFYSDAGQFTIAEARWWSSEWGPRFLMPDALGSYPVAVALFVLWGLALTGLLLGWRTRLAAWLAWLLTLWFVFRNPTFGNGGDEVLRLATLYIAAGVTVMPAVERAFSLDRRRALRERGMRQEGESGPPAPPVMPAWPLRLLQVQLCVIYAVAGFWKVVGPTWWDGTALWYALANGAFSRFGVPSWAWLELPFTVLTITIAWWELLFPALVAWSRTRRLAVGFGLLLHAMILATMNIGVFPFVMMGLFPVFFTGDESGRIAGAVGRVARRIRQRLGGRSSTRKSAASAAFS